MAPYLIELGPFRLSTYALLNVVAYLVGVSIASRLGRRVGVPPKRMVDLTFWLLLAAIVGARIGYLIEQAPTYLDLCLDDTLPLIARPPICDDLWRPWHGGFVFYGGLILAVPTVALLVRRYKLRFWPTADAIGPALAAAHAIGRLGCFFGGCCYGEVCHVPWAVRFPVDSLAGPLARHPTQLYESGAEALIALLLWRMFAKRRFDGQVFLSYLAMYGVARFVIEMFRGDPQRGYAVALSPQWLVDLLGLPSGAAPLLSWAQVISAALVTLALTLMWRFHTRPPAPTARLPLAREADRC